MKYQKFEKGQSVKIKNGVKDYEKGIFDMTDWQGRIIDILEDSEGVFLEVQWDSLTLKQIPFEYIEDSINEDLEYESIVLDPADVVTCEVRDTEADVHKAQSEIDKMYFEIDEEE